MSSIAMFEGYGRKRRRAAKRSGGKSGQRARFTRAAKACKGRSLAAFRRCMKQHLSK
jgi:hypothetical protein